MTLGAWFRDYVYIPLGGNRKGIVRWLINIFAVWLFTGLWHGAEWNFVLWGLSFAVLLVLEKVLKGWIKKRNFLTEVLGHVYMVLVILVTFLLFHNTKRSAVFGDIAGLFRASFEAGAVSDINGYLLRNRLGILVIALVGATPVPMKIWQNFCRLVLQKDKKRMVVRVLECVFSLALLVLCTAYLIDGSFNPFLYFRF